MVRPVAVHLTDIRRRGVVAVAVAALSGTVAAERERWALWAPVFLGAGVVVYFLLPMEPDIRIALGIVGVASLVGMALWHFVGPGAAAGAILVAITATGSVIASWETHRSAAPVLDRAGFYRGLTGRVVAVENFPDGARVRLERLDWRRNTEAMPYAVRVKLRVGAVPDVGSRIRLSARLSPPPRPSYPGAYDFARTAWFDRLGAVGFALSSWREVPRQGAPSAYDRVKLAVSRFRNDVSDRLRLALPGLGGGVAAALLAGDRSSLDAAVLKNLRLSGLAHLLAISGLHIGMVAMIAFGTLRIGFALREAWARDRPIKKWAALGALLATAGYLVLSGATVPTQRAFLMTGIVLLAVLTDRQAISMRLVAVAATAVIVLAPHSLIGPSFQLSFAAVIALVAVYETVKLDPGRDRTTLRRIGFYLAAVCLTTVIAGAATFPFAVHHFGRVAQYSVLANLAAIPVVTFIVMPFGLLSLAAMPLGLEHWTLIPAGWGIDAVLWIADTVAALPGAGYQLPPFPMAGLAAICVGGLWCALWKRRWRYIGIPVVLAGIASCGFTPIPIAILHDEAGQAAVVWDGGLWVERRNRDKFAQSVWSEKTALPILGDWQDLASLRDSPIRCDPAGCVFTTQDMNGVSGRVVIALSTDPRGMVEDCLMADVARLSVQPHPGLCRERPALGPADLRRDGVTAIFLTRAGPVLDSVSAHRGQRPWTGYIKAVEINTSAEALPNVPER
ncbi:ComEC family competence protein [Rhodospirillaceae bacterium KN72]|uniref:ComEC family competence protein n=1 Tax=Pacificispira spongiicola TaxID=2729598 RepID=A0A7Y0DYN7_9PROT|nr:ComEC/Rec2 family competence protein [Pacificispira spongiicola]NMM44021.1 ComEC family competence protein [Pacificispira spongiicola]